MVDMGESLCEEIQMHSHVKLLDVRECGIISSTIEILEHLELLLYFIHSMLEKFHLRVGIGNNSSKSGIKPLNHFLIAWWLGSCLSFLN
mgnify:CR=1 FL=1